MSHAEILYSLEPRIGELLEEYKKTSARIDWSYHDYLPLEAYHADPRRHQPLSDVAYASVEMALLTEAILPWYTTALMKNFQDSPGPMQEFVHLWTSEEDQHSTLLETYLLLTNNGDHTERNRLRKTVLAGGWTYDSPGAFEGLVYATIQEMATRAFYIHASQACERDDPLLTRAMRRLSRDETLHMAFYRDVVKSHLEIEPDYVLPLARVMMDFVMPGHVLPDFQDRTDFLAKNNVFSPAHYYDDVIMNLWTYWDLDGLAPKLNEASEAYSQLLKFRGVLRKLRDRSLRRSRASSQSGLEV